MAVRTMPQRRARVHAGAMKTTTRSRICAFLLVFGAVAFAAADLLRRLVEPGGNPDAQALTQAVAQHPASWETAGLLSIVAGMCLAVSALALVPQHGVRGARITASGAVMMSLGAMASIGHAVAFYSPYSLFAAAHTSASQLAAIDAASESSLQLLVLIYTFMAGMTIGPIVLFIGLHRAHRIPVWSVAAVIVFVVCGSTGGILPGAIGAAAALAAFVPVAGTLLHAMPGHASPPLGSSPLKAA